MHEELQTRGYVFQSLLTLGGRRFGPVLALGLTSFVFGGLHGGNPNVTLRGVIILIVVGLEFGIAYLVTRRLWLPIGMHFSWNLVEGTLLGYPVSGQSSPSFLTLERGGPASWTGGDFGPEGGWLVLFVSVLDIGFLLGLAALRFWRPDPFPREAEGQVALAHLINHCRDRFCERRRPLRSGFSKGTARLDTGAGRCR